MKMLSLVPAALVAAVALPAASAPAAAQTTRVVVHHDNGYHNGRDHWHHRVVYRTQCHTEWRHHHRERMCHRVRVTPM